MSKPSHRRPSALVSADRSQRPGTSPRLRPGAWWRSSGAAAIFVLVTAACVDGTALDAGDGVDDDAGIVDAGPSYPPYEREPGWYPDEGRHDDPARCGVAPYRWWGTSDLGALVETQLKHQMSQSLLEGIHNQLNGFAILRREPMSGATVYRVRYTTQDQGELTEATGIIAYPDVTMATELPVLLYLHGTTGFSDQCSPSRGIDNALGPNYFNTVAPVGLFASWGYIVVAPDYLGLKSLGDPSPEFHPYFVAEPTAISSLDAVRAAENLLAEVAPNVIPGRKVVLGVSQGGHASAFVTRYQPHYAPEMDFAGAVFNVPPLDLLAESTAALATPSPTNQGNAAVVLVAQDSWYQSSPNRIADVLLPSVADDVIDYMNENCQLPGLSGSPEAIFTEGLLSGAIDPWTCYGAENSLVHTSLARLDDTPALVVLAEDDQLVNTPVERESVTTLCGEGVPLQFLECQDTEHTEGFFYALDDMFDFLEARLDGVPLAANACAITPPQKCSSDPR